jgi:hypothetical protein
MRERVTRLKGVEIDWGKTYVGTVKVTWNGGKESIFVVPSMQKRDTGGAFIGSDESFKVFGEDIWAYPSRIPGGLKVGDMLKFKVEIDHFWSYPVAVNIQRVEQMVADGGKDLEVSDATASSLDAERTVRHRRKSRSPSRERSDSRSRKANKQPKPQSADSDNDQKTDTDKSSGSVHDIVASLPTPNRTSSAEKDAKDSVVDELISGENSNSADATSSIWKRYLMEDGENYWWWCEVDNDCFLEANPFPWTRYMDPESERHYWWKSEDKWFWI